MINTISVIICTYNRKTWVEDLLVSISEQTIIPDEVIIVDAYEREMVYLYPENINVRLIRSNVKALTYQRNLGIDLAKGDIISFLDDDVLLSANYFETILTAFENDFSGSIGGIGGFVTNEWCKNSRISIVEKIMKYFGIYDGRSMPGTVSPSDIFDELNTLQPFSGIRYVDLLPESWIRY